ncbi:hypothetical protein GCM10027590_68390 [Nocardiopsis nanhaiensis]
MSKTCTKCHETKVLEDFGRDKYAKYGRRPDCKTCRRDQDRERYRDRWENDSEFRDRKLQRNRDRWENDSEFRDRKLQRNRDRWENDPDFRARDAARNAKRRALQRGQPADGSFIPDWLAHHEEMDSWNCHLCGGAFRATDTIHWDHRDPVSDRFTGDAPKAGTVVANMAAAHERCNLARGDVPLAEWHARLGLPDGVG